MGKIHWDKLKPAKTMFGGGRGILIPYKAASGKTSSANSKLASPGEPAKPAASTKPSTDTSSVKESFPEVWARKYEELIKANPKIGAREMEDEYEKAREQFSRENSATSPLKGLSIRDDDPDLNL
jgi:hypothetical protein